jgi:hypothetical protein
VHFGVRPFSGVELIDRIGQKSLYYTKLKDERPQLSWTEQRISNVFCWFITPYYTTPYNGKNGSMQWNSSLVAVG